MIKIDKEKLNIFLKFLVLLTLGGFIYFLLTINANLSDIAETNRSEIKAHRNQVEAGGITASNELSVAATANRARADIGLCIFSVSPTRRTPEYVKSCYDRVEAMFKVKVTRYGDGI